VPDPSPAAPASTRPWRRPAALLRLLLLPLPLGACVSLRPFAEVRREHPVESFVEVDGRQVHVERQGSGDPVVLLHGFGASSYCWRLVIPELARRFQVIAIDLNGFGWTERPRDPLSYTREGQERLVLGMLHALGIARAQFVGHSYGGGLTLFLASRHPEVVGSMVLVDSSAPTYAEDRRSRLAALRPLDGLALQIALRPKHVRRSLTQSVADPAVVTPELVDAYLARLRVEGEADAFYGLTAPLRTVSGMARTARPSGEEIYLALGKLAIPSLVVWGADDLVIRAEAGRRAALRLPGSEFQTIAACGHLPMEERPEELLRLVLPFLERHRPSAAAAS
jgi:pimeloyl-ACP methyl ester carboxylesterase